tara:strand:- start:188 stop:358 length:171 start_codon:yes stop_codon:yes gene_type:complete
MINMFSPRQLTPPEGYFEYKYIREASLELMRSGMSPDEVAERIPELKKLYKELNKI